MAVMMSGLYDALKAAGAPDDKARIAAEEGAAHKDEMADIRSTQRLHTWILSFQTAMLIGILWKLFGA